MEKKNSCARTGFSTILWGVLAILLCAAPCVRADVDIPSDGKEYNIPGDFGPAVSGNLWVYGTVNLLTGASVSQSIYVQTGGTLNMYSGTIGMGWSITVSLDAAGVTIFGTGFATDGTSLDYGEWTPPDGSAVLTGNYADGSTIDLWIFSDTAINLQPPPSGGPIEVEIDIKPGSDLNPINPGSNGLIPVAILTTDDFDATTVDPETVSLAGAEVAVRGKAEKLMARLEDVDGDGDLDLLVQVETQSDGDPWESGTVTLTGKTYDGQDIEGTDEVIIVPPAE